MRLQLHKAKEDAKVKGAEAENKADDREKESLALVEYRDRREGESARKAEEIEKAIDDPDSFLAKLKAQVPEDRASQLHQCRCSMSIASPKRQRIACMTAAVKD